MRRSAITYWKHLLSLCSFWLEALETIFIIFQFGTTTLGRKSRYESKLWKSRIDHALRDINLSPYKLAIILVCFILLGLNLCLYSGESGNGFNPYKSVIVRIYLSFFDTTTIFDEVDPEYRKTYPDYRQTNWINSSETL